MPKEKRKHITGNSHKHAPLGQVIAEDENRSKYATVRSRQKLSESSNGATDRDQDDELLDEKSSRRIFELGKQQLLEIELEEQKEKMKQQQQLRTKKLGVHYDDSSDDEDDMDAGSIIGDLDDEEE